MDKIRIIQPYRLWRRLLSALGSKKYYIFAALGITLLMILKELYNSSGIIPYIFFGSVILVFFLFAIYNPFYRYYKPRPRLHSFNWKKFYHSFYDYYGVCAVMIGYSIGFYFWYTGSFSIDAGPFSDKDWFWPPFCASLIGCIAIIMYSVLKGERVRAENHEDIDYNVKVDLNDLYGINDKLLLCYQNFDYSQKRLNAGNYLLGLSEKSFYFIIKQEIVEKYVINFKDLTAIGSLSLYDYSLLHFESKNQIKIDLLMDQGASLVVNCAFLIQRIWQTLDSFIINGNVSSGRDQFRRRLTISEDGAKHNKKKESTLIENRVIDISYSDGVVSEIKAAPLIESNRIIEI